MDSDNVRQTERTGSREHRRQVENQIAASELRRARVPEGIPWERSRVRTALPGYNAPAQSIFNELHAIVEPKLGHQLGLVSFDGLGADE